MWTPELHSRNTLLESWEVDWLSFECQRPPPRYITQLDLAPHLTSWGHWLPSTYHPLNVVSSTPAPVCIPKINSPPLPFPTQTRIPEPREHYTTAFTESCTLPFPTQTDTHTSTSSFWRKSYPTLFTESVRLGHTWSPLPFLPSLLCTWRASRDRVPHALKRGWDLARPLRDRHPTTHYSYQEGTPLDTSPKVTQMLSDQDANGSPSTLSPDRKKKKKRIWKMGEEMGRPKTSTNRRT